MSKKWPKMRHLLVSQSSALPPWGDFRRSESTVGHRRLGNGVSVILSLGFRVRGSTLELESEEKKKDSGRPCQIRRFFSGFIWIFFVPT